MKNANVTKEEIVKQIAAGRDFVVYNYMTGEVVSFHKSRDSGMRKAAKMGYRFNCGNLRAGYGY